MSALSRKIQSFVKENEIEASEIADEAGLAPITIQNILSRKVKNPRQDTIDKIEEALARLEEKRNETVSEEDEESEEDELYELPMTDSIGKRIKSITLFNAHDDDQIASLSGITCVYMIYAGRNNWIGESENNIRLTGTPEYIGKTKNLPDRINDHRQKWWWRGDWIDYGVCIEIDERSGLDTELEKTLIRVFSPSLNKTKG